MTRFDGLGSLPSTRYTQVVDFGRCFPLIRSGCLSGLFMPRTYICTAAVAAAADDDAA